LIVKKKNPQGVPNKYFFEHAYADYIASFNKKIVFKLVFFMYEYCMCMLLSQLCTSVGHLKFWGWGALVVLLIFSFFCIMIWALKNWHNVPLFAGEVILALVFIEVKHYFHP